MKGEPLSLKRLLEQEQQPPRNRKGSKSYPRKSSVYPGGIEPPADPSATSHKNKFTGKNKKRKRKREREKKEEKNDVVFI